jgi:hypothetical protein
MQYAQFVLLRDLGEKALAGKNGWIFYRPGLDYLTQRQPSRSNGSQPDPASVICEFRNQLAARGIHLIVMPAPNKASIYPEHLSRRAASLPGAVCETTQSLLRQLQAADVEVIDLFELYARAKTATPGDSAPPLYLARDTHWSPRGIDLAAEAVAQRLEQRGWIQRGQTVYHNKPAPTERVGDLVRMLKVPRIQARLGTERVPCLQVVQADGKALYEDDPQSEILVLGDSFLRIFHKDEPGSAGFVAHLAERLRQPISSIAYDGSASTLVRQELHRRPALLQSTKVVIWEFIERDIRFGTEGWQFVPLPPQNR